MDLKPYKEICKEANSYLYSFAFGEGEDVEIDTTVDSFQAEGVASTL